MQAASAPVSNKIGLGCVTFGREIDEAASHDLLDHAFSQGVRHFDTASAYSQGTSERILGRWLSSRCSDAAAVAIATKILPPYGPQDISAAVGESLSRLGVQTIDLLYLHRWDATADGLASFAALDALVSNGTVRALGVCNYNLPQLRSALALQQKHKLTPFSVVQNNHNLAVSDLPTEFRAFCAAQQLAIVTYSPLGAGFLTGKHRSGVQPGSRFDLIPGHQDVYFNDAAYRRLARLEAVAARTGLSPTHLALSWALHEPGIAHVLVGARTCAHLDQALAALTFHDAEIFAELTNDQL